MYVVSHNGGMAYNSLQMGLQMGLTMQSTVLLGLPCNVSLLQFDKLGLVSRGISLCVVLYCFFCILKDNFLAIRILAELRW